MHTPDINITFISADGAKRSVTAHINQSLMQVALDHNINGIDAICGGCIACATCHIHIPTDWHARVHAQDNDISEEEHDMLDLVKTGRTTNSRLACQIKVTPALNGLTVTIPDQ